LQILQSHNDTNEHGNPVPDNQPPSMGQRLPSRLSQTRSDIAAATEGDSNAPAHTSPNAARLASAQFMHDRATDDRPEDFLDTIEGEQWLADVSERLANGENIRWSMDAMGRRTAGSQLCGSGMSTS
jgi:hypothetical protein